VYYLSLAQFTSLCN